MNAPQTCETRSGGGVGVGELARLFVYRDGGKQILYDQIPTTEDFIRVIHSKRLQRRRKGGKLARKSSGFVRIYYNFFARK